MWQQLRDVIQKHQSFLITTHINPDGDGIGSACALSVLLKKMEKDVRVVFDGRIPEKYAFLDFDHNYEVYNPEESYANIEVVVIVDAHQLERLGSLSNLMKSYQPVLVIIDHHPKLKEIQFADPFVRNKSVVEVIAPQASSAGSMIYALYKECGYELSIEAAMGIYVSVMSDTGRFSYSSTDRQAHKIADECIERGVDPDWMYSRIYQQVTLAEFKVFAKALQHMEVHFYGQVIVQKILLDDYVGVLNEVYEVLQSDLEYFHEFNKIIAGVDCIVLLCEIPDNQVRVSLRASGNFRVDSIANQLGGGGHSKAAGALLTGSVEQVKDQVLSAIECQKKDRADRGSKFGFLKAKN